MQGENNAIDFGGRHYDRDGCEIGDDSRDVSDGGFFVPGIHRAPVASDFFQDTGESIKSRVISSPRLSRGRRVVLAGTLAAGFVVAGIRAPNGHLTYATAANLSSFHSL